ncbi:hypothetical protein GFS24_04645 [Chitinophaga sp. SYP-B3965]|uniref:SMI1/KNR4 family protein n=1 Tax=Chitinophaga sp. SYP-B3965 TaxID=2663120 RepID=UPI001299FE74|nr:SMI1/KNR4 family protein [Chitinophaga sp. SYP-B3965]MRG44388.1 hypothetical protein [Chitinophaga sp. SYP-B3965]
MEENQIILAISEFWKNNEVTHSQPVSEIDLKTFYQSNRLVLPGDILDYFKELNGTEGYDNNLFKLYPFDEFKTVKDELEDWIGPPDYRNITSKLTDHKNVFVIADHSFHLFTYAIKLYDKESDANEIYIICGEEFKIIAYSFTKFLELYLKDDKSLYF